MPDDKHIVGAGKDGLIRVWEMKQKGNLIFTFKGTSFLWLGITFDPLVWLLF